MATTARYGLQTFGGRVPGSFRDDGYAYTLADRQTIDALLAALEAHNHNGGDRLMDPNPPSLTVITDTTSKLPGGRTYYYKVAYLDQWGLETAGSPEVSVTIAPGPPTPSAPVLKAGSSASSHLGPGSYYYAVAAYVGDATRQTLPSQTQFLSLTGSFNQITLTMPAADPSATGWVIYRKGPQETQLYYLATTVTTQTTYIDNGTVTSDCTKTPYSVDSTSTQNKIQVTLAAADQEPVKLGVAVTSTSGGSLAAGTYQYKIVPSVVLSGTTYTGAVTDVSVSVPASSKVQFTISYLGGGFSGGTSPPSVNAALYGRTTATLKLLSNNSITSGTSSVVATDDGSAAGTTNYAVTTPTWVTPLSEIHGWNIYRSNNSGAYPSGSLVHRVVETEGGDLGGNLVRTWYDTGDLLLVGNPRSQSATFQPPSASASVTHAETCLYSPSGSGPVPGPYVSTALDAVNAMLMASRTRTYTFTSVVAPVIGFARYYPGINFSITNVRASLSSGISVSYNVKVSGAALFGSPQAVSTAGQTTAIVPKNSFTAADYLTIDLVSGSISASDALMIHVDIQAVS